ncbi:MAG: hypothetical protein AAF512_19800, partial [Pseudomonadota bacterium]
MKKLLMIILTGFIALIALTWLTAIFALSSKDHSQYDLPRPSTTGQRTNESAEHQTVAKMIAEGLAKPPPAKGRELLKMMRTQMDERGLSM